MNYLKFDQYLEELTQDYKGKYDYLINRSALLYRATTKLISDNDLPRAIRAKLFAVVGYFVIPDDFYPEEIHGPIGFIDDLMLVIFVFREILEIESYGKLEAVYDGDIEDLKRIVEIEYHTLIEENFELYEQVIEFMDF